MTLNRSLDVMVDFDDVLYPWSETAHKLCVEAGITNGHQITQWHFWEDYGVERELVWKVLRDGTVDGRLYAAPPIPGALRHLRRLRYKGHRIHIVTARGFGGDLGPDVQRMTREYILRENVPLDSLTFTKNKTEVHADVALDDGVHNVEALLDAGVDAYLMDKPHNRHFSAPGFGDWQRVYSVGEFADRILRFM